MGKYFSKQNWSYMFYTITHPMDGYYWIRHRGYGSVPLAILMVILFSFSFTANRLMASFVVNDLDPRGVDALYELMGVMSFYLLLCVSNWSITCLMTKIDSVKLPLSMQTAAVFVVRPVSARSIG